MTVFGNYCIYFRLTKAETIVVRILHGARDIQAASFGDEE